MAKVSGEQLIPSMRYALAVLQGETCSCIVKKRHPHILAEKTQGWTRKNVRNYVNMEDRVAFLIIQNWGNTVEVLTSGLNDVRK